MITRKDFLEHGFKVVYKPYKTSFKNVKFECIVYEKDGLWIHTEWADGDDSLRHAYMTDCNTEYYWNEYCQTKMDFEGFIASLLRYLRNEKKILTRKYGKEIAKLKKEHERKINDLDKKIGLLKGVSK